MHLVDRHGLAALVAVAALREVVGIGPIEALVAADDGGGRRPEFAGEAEWICLERQVHATGADDLELIFGSLADLRCEDLPHAALVALPHLVAATIPLIEAADHGDALCMRCPDGKVGARDVLMRSNMRAEAGIERAVRALYKQVVVHIPEDAGVGIGIVELPFSTRVFRPKLVADPSLLSLDEAFEKVAPAPLELRHNGSIAVDRFDGGCVWHEGTDRHAICCLMRAEYRERVAMPGGLDRSHFAFRRPPSCLRHASLPNSFYYLVVMHQNARGHPRCPVHIRELSDRRRTIRPAPCSRYWTSTSLLGSASGRPPCAAPRNRRRNPP